MIEITVKHLESNLAEPTHLKGGTGRTSIDTSGNFAGVSPTRVTTDGVHPHDACIKNLIYHVCLDRLFYLLIHFTS